jgi:hypothetical protein
MDAADEEPSEMTAFVILARESVSGLKALRHPPSNLIIETSIA